MLCLLSTGVLAARAEESASVEGLDRVTYGPALPRSTNPWNAPPSVNLVGKIEKIDDEVLEIVLVGGERRKVPSDRVERIEVAWETPAAAAAHARFVERRYLAALKENDDLLRAGGFPMWQQRVLLAELVESAEAIGKPELAGQLYLELAKRSAPDYLMAVIPLNWTNRELSPALEKAARSWLAQEDAHAGMLGASWLLFSDSADEAKKRLQKIQTSSSSKKLLQRLAAMQLWRATPPSSTTEEMGRWFAARDSLLLPLQLGPTEFMAERFSRIDRLELAIGEWLRIAAAHSDHPHRCRLALESAQSRLVRRSETAQVTSVIDWQKVFAPQN